MKLLTFLPSYKLHLFVTTTVGLWGRARGPAALGDGGDRLFSGEEVLTASACSRVLCDRHLHPRHLVASRGSSLLQPQRGLSPRQENQTHRAAVHSALRFGSCDVFEPMTAGCNCGTERPFSLHRPPVPEACRGPGEGPVLPSDAPLCSRLEHVASRSSYPPGGHLKRLRPRGSRGALH